MLWLSLLGSDNLVWKKKVDRPPIQLPGQLVSAPPTALTIRVMSTAAPLGMPFGQADVSAVPRSMLTNTMISLTVTSPLPSQLPTHVAVVGSPNWKFAAVWSGPGTSGSPG